jgi:hypothetical protein
LSHKPGAKNNNVKILPQEEIKEALDESSFIQPDGPVEPKKPKSLASKTIIGFLTVLPGIGVISED